MNNETFPDVLAAIHFLETEGLKLDIVFPDGSHRYYSTHCRHDRHASCNATSLAPDVLRQPAQCKTCEAPCQCPEPGCHTPAAKEAS